MVEMLGECMNNPLISVIVPIYNVELYLRDCVDSIINQTYSNLEIILVDDGSPDRCPEICDEYVKIDKRVKVIHQENGGLAHARNVGIANSKGEYLTFIDSDDYVSKCYVESLYRGLMEYDADVSIASFHPFKDGELCARPSESVAYKEISKEDAIKHYCSIDAGCSMPFISACNKVYRRSLFKEIVFPKGKLYEDAFTTYKLIDNAEKIIFTTSKLYFYRINSQSILGQSFKEKHLEMVDAFRSGFDYFDEKGEKDISRMFVPPLLMREIYCWWGAKEILKNKIIAQTLLKDYREKCKSIICKRDVDFFWYTTLKLISFIPWLYILYRKYSLKHIGNRI